MDFKVKNLGPCKIDSPLIKKGLTPDCSIVPDDQLVLFDPVIDEHMTVERRMSEGFEVAGPREKIYFDPGQVRCAIVTCGGLCPGINNVIRSIVMQSWYFYGVKDIMGIRYGYNGLRPESEYEPISLNPDTVKSIHREGGTILGSSRGGTDDLNVQVDMLEKMKIDILYAIGGDGTLKGAHGIAEIAHSRGMKLAVIGIPKTIDNDISFIERSFGYMTAVSVAEQAIDAAHVEAKGANNCIGLVKLMGRHSGFIAANAAIASNDVNFVLIPESRFELYGGNGLLKHLEKRMLNRHHAVVCVAEGAGQELLMKDAELNNQKDKSGNIKLKDIGHFLKDEIDKYFKEKNIEINLKYIDPSYIIRSTPAISEDSTYCAILGQYAVHAGMAGKTDMLVGQWCGAYTHVPTELAVSRRKVIDVKSHFWHNVISATGQPIRMVNQ